jgi:hypothetical protein
MSFYRVENPKTDKLEAFIESFKTLKSSAYFEQRQKKSEIESETMGNFEKSSDIENSLEKISDLIDLYQVR